MEGDGRGLELGRRARNGDWGESRWKRYSRKQLEKSIIFLQQKSHTKLLCTKSIDNIKNYIDVQSYFTIEIFV